MKTAKRHLLPSKAHLLADLAWVRRGAKEERKRARRQTYAPPPVDYDEVTCGRHLLYRQLPETTASESSVPASTLTPIPA